MKKFLIIVGSIVAGLAVLAGVIVALVFWFTGGAVEASERFLALLAQDKIEEAYQSTATAFRSQQDAASFATTVKAIGLTRYASASWSNREIQNNRATLEGSVTTTDGGTIPLTIQLVSEGDEWKVLGLTTPTAGAAIADEGGTRKPAAPDDATVRQLVNQTMRSFSEGLDRNDFGAFYATISERWKQQITGDGLGRAFQPLVDQKTRFGNIENLDPTFTSPPAIDGDGLLVASGIYATEPQRARFELSYIHEAPSWKLFGIRVIPESAEAAAAAPPAETAAPAPAATGDAYTVVENAELTGRVGRVVVAFPEGASASSTRIEIRPEGGKEASASGYGRIVADLLPGKYDVQVSGVVIPGVEVRSRHDSKIAVGVLRVALGSSTRVEIFRGGQSVASGYGKGQYGLPVGAYEVEISGKREPITITAGGIIDF